MQKAEFNGPILEAVDAEVASAWHKRVEVSGVNWKVFAGELWVVGGRHGSGKTDLLMTMAGLLLPAGGSVRIFGNEVAGMSERESLQQRKRIGFVFKGGGRMFADLTVAENVALALCYHRNWSMEQARTDVEEVLEQTELTPLADERAQFVASDWQQRVGLARALALKPDVLFLDEPAAGLETRHRQWWRTFLDRWTAQAGRKVTVIISTGDFALWRGRYAVIKDRRWQVLEERTENPVID